MVNKSTTDKQGVLDRIKGFVNLKENLMGTISFPSLAGQYSAFNLYGNGVNGKLDDDMVILGNVI